MKDEEFRSLYRHLVEYEEPSRKAEDDILKNLLSVLTGGKKTEGNRREML